MKINNVRKALMFLLVLVLITAVPAVAFAADIKVTADSTSVKTGETVTVTVVVSDSNVAVVDGVFTYDPSLLTYLSSTGGASDGHINMISLKKGGSDSLTAVIKFKATGKGEAEVKVTLDSVLNYNGKALNNADAGVSITVKATPSSGDKGNKPSSSPTVDYSDTGVVAKNVKGAENNMYIWRSLNSLTLPSGFVDKQVQYGEEYVGGAAIPDADDFVLLYLSEADGKNAGYYVYDDKKDILFPYVTVTSVLSNFTLIWPDDSVQLPAGYEETTLKLDKKEAPAWTLKDSDGDVYLVYARDASGETNFYLYDKDNESVQRYTTSASVSQPESTVTPKPTEEPAVTPVSEEKTDIDLASQPIVLIALCAACIVFAILAIVFIVLYSKSSRGKRKAESFKSKPEEKKAKPEQKKARPEEKETLSEGENGQKELTVKNKNMNI